VQRLGTAAPRDGLFDGTPAAGVRVEYTRGAHAGHGARKGRTTSTRSSDGTSIRVPASEGDVLTDAHGRFELTGLDADQWTCCALLSPYAWTSMTVQLDGEEHAPLELSLPEVGEVRGRLLVPDGVDRARLSLEVRSAEQSPAQGLFMHGRDELVISSQGDRFQITDAARGDYWITVRWLTEDPRGSNWSSRSIVRQRITVGALPQQLELDVAPHIPKDVGPKERP
jgi:hypothetical protein